jgi:hypothetical protein
MPRVYDGYGEMVLVRRGEDGTLNAPSAIEYSAIAPDLHALDPRTLVFEARAAHTPGTEAALAQGVADGARDRYARCLPALQWHSARARLLGGRGYECFFVPRTLYELIVINEIMRQERTTAYAAWPLQPMPVWYQITAPAADHASPAIDLRPANLALAQAVNALIIAKVIATLGEREQLPLERAHLERILNAELTLFSEHVSLNGAHPNRFPAPGHHGGISLGARLAASAVRTERGAIMRSMKAAMAIEMATTGNFLLYRASEFQDNVVLARSVLSYNTGFWATLLYDTDFATSVPVFMLGRNDRTGRCVVIPYPDMVRTSFAFHVPLGDALDQLHGTHQQSHVWCKATQTMANGLALGAPEARAGSHWIYMIFHQDDQNALNAGVQAYQRRQWHPEPVGTQLPTVFQAAQQPVVAGAGSVAKGIICSLCAGAHRGRASTSLGRWHQCPACGGIYCNLCAKWRLWRSTLGARTRACNCGRGTTVLME